REKGRVVGHEKVESDPGIPDKRLMLTEPEFASVLKHLERQGNILSTIIRRAWDGITLEGLTKNSPICATGAHVSVIGHITVEELKRYLTATEMANGFGNRFLWFCVKRSKALPEGSSVPPGPWEGLRGHLGEAFRFAK